MKRRDIVRIAIYVAVVVLCAVVIYVVPSVAGLLDATYLAEYGELEVTDDIDDVWIVRNETVYGAKVGGDMNLLVEEGSLLKSHARIYEITGDPNSSIRLRYNSLVEHLGDAMGSSKGGTPKPGYVSFTADGYEAELSSQTMSDLTKSDLKSIGNDYEKLASKSSAPGEPIFRITNNGAWWLVFFVDSDRAERYVEGSSVTFTMEEELSGTIHSVEEQGDESRIIVTCKQHSATYLNMRKTSIHIELEKSDGLLIRTESICEVDGMKGVIVKDKVGENYFMPIQIKATDGTTAAVELDLYMDENSEFVETIHTYDEIVKKPSEREIEEVSSEKDKEE